MLRGEADYAVIPQENTIGGAVTNYVDALIRQEDVYVVGEVVLPISQTLMGLPGTELSDIRTVCSHAQGIAQSAAWRSEHLPDAVTEENLSFLKAKGVRTVELGCQSMDDGVLLAHCRCREHLEAVHRHLFQREQRLHDG